MSDSTHSAPVTALVEYEIRAENNTMAQWLDVWSHRGEDAFIGEPETTAYEAVTSIEHENQVLIFERYQSEASIKIHSARPAHATLVETMGERNMTRRRVMSNLFSDIANYGWWSRPEYVPSMRQEGLRMTTMVTRFPDDETRQRYIDLTGAHAEYCRTAEPETLVYSGGLALRDSDRGPEIKAGDLMFTAVFANEAAAEKHRIDSRHLELQKILADVPLERVFVKTYTTTSCGFLWSAET